MKLGNQHGANSMADWLARPMFVFSLLFLLIVACLIVVWVDIPRVDSMTGSVKGESSAQYLSLQLASLRLGSSIATLILIVWSVFVAEFIFNILKTGNQGQSFWKRHSYGLLICLAPPLRMAAPSYAKGGRIWLPGLGWRMPGRRLSKQLEKSFSKPMLLIAMLILPVLIVEFGMQGYVRQHLWLRLALHVSTGLIWVAFSIEFIVRVSATHRKLEYLKKNWIDLAIVLLPLISFLRSLRVIRAIRLAKFAQAQQLVRIGRIYRLRSLAVKVLRALILFEFFHRILRIKPERKLAALRAEYRERKADLEELKTRIDKLDLEIREGNSTENPPVGLGTSADGQDVDPDCKMS